MINQLISRLINYLLGQGVIKEADKDLYIFGFNQIWLLSINVGTTILVGLTLGMLWQSVVFMVAYIPLRRYAGGYHTNSPYTCYFFSIGLIIGVLMIIQWVSFDMTDIVVTMLLSAALIIIKAPIESANKPLCKIEEKHYKKKQGRFFL